MFGLFTSFSGILSSSSLTSDKGLFFGMYYLSNLLKFLLLPLCQLLKKSSKFIYYCIRNFLGYLMTYSSRGSAHLNICLTFAERASVNNLTTSLNPTGVSLFSHILTPQILLKSPSSNFIRIDILLEHFMANWQHCSKPLGVESCSAKGSKASLGTSGSVPSGIMTTYGPLLSKSIGLLGSVTANPFASFNLSRNGGLTPAKILGNLVEIQSLFHEAKSLISFRLAEDYIGHANLMFEVKTL